MKLKYSCDQIDILNNKKFRYYVVDKNKYLKVNNQYPCSLYCNQIGKEIELVIDNTHNKDLIIKLSYDGEKYSYLRIKNEDIPVARVTLICCSFTSKYGAKWYVKKYNGNIILE